MKKSKFLIFSFIILSFFAIISFSSVKRYRNNTFARYYTNIDGNTTVDVAVPIINNTVETLSVPLGTVTPNTVTEYTFNVTNFDLDNHVTETSFDYNITVSNTDYLPVEYELQKDGVTINVLTEGNTPTYVLPHTTPTVHNYKLIVRWNSIDNDFRYANGIDIVTITIDAKQKVS